MSASYPYQGQPVQQVAPAHPGFFGGLASHFHHAPAPAPVVMAQPQYGGSASVPQLVPYGGGGSASMMHPGMVHSGSQPVIMQPAMQPVVHGGSLALPPGGGSVSMMHPGMAPSGSQSIIPMGVVNHGPPQTVAPPQHHGFFAGVASHFHHPQPAPVLVHPPQPAMYHQPQQPAPTPPYANVAASVAQQEGPTVSPYPPGGVAPANLRPMPGAQVSEIGKTVYPPTRLAHEEQKIGSYVGNQGENVHLIVNQKNYQNSHAVPESDFHHVNKFIPQQDMHAQGVHNMHGGHPSGHFGPNLPAGSHLPAPPKVGATQGRSHMPHMFHMPFGHHGAQPVAAPTYGAPAAPTYGAQPYGGPAPAYGSPSNPAYRPAMQTQPYGGSAFGHPAAQPVPAPTYGAPAVSPYGGSYGGGSVSLPQPYGGSASMPQPYGGSPVYGQ